MRLKTLEEGLKHVHSLSTGTNRSPKNEKSNNFFGILSSNTRTKKRSTSQPRPSTITKSSLQMTDEKQTSSAATEIKPINNLKKKNSSGECLLKKSLWASRNKVIDNSEKENAEMNENAMVDDEMGNTKGITGSNKEKKDLELADNDCEDMVSGFLYDRLQKEVINLRKSCDLKDSTLTSKDEEIKVGQQQLSLLLSICVCVCVCVFQ